MMGIEILIRKQYNTIDGKPFDLKMAFSSNR